jgi:hypothetical protein
VISRLYLGYLLARWRYQLYQFSNSQVTAIAMRRALKLGRRIYYQYKDIPLFIEVDFTILTIAYIFTPTLPAYINWPIIYYLHWHYKHYYCLHYFY